MGHRPLVARDFRGNPARRLMLKVYDCDFDGLTGAVCALRCQVLHPQAQVPAPGSRLRYPEGGPQYVVTEVRRDPFPPGSGVYLLWEVALVSSTPSEAD